MHPVRRTAFFEQCLRDLHLSPALSERILAAVIWALERNPEHYPGWGETLTGTTIRVAVTQAFPPSIPPYYVYYTVDEQGVCTLQFMEVALRRLREDR